MKQINAPVVIQIPVFDAALRAALGAKIYGVSVPAPDDPLKIAIWADDAVTPADVTTISGIVNSHDPVFLSADKTSISANGTDSATITVKAPKANAAAVSLLVGGTVVPVSMTNGSGAVTITSSVPTLIAVTVQNGAARTSDQISISAI